MSLQAMRRSGGVVPRLGQGWGASALVLGTGILLIQYLVLVVCAPAMERVRHEVQGNKRLLFCEIANITASEPSIVTFHL